MHRGVRRRPPVRPRGPLGHRPGPGDGTGDPRARPTVPRPLPGGPGRGLGARPRRARRPRGEHPGGRTRSPTPSPRSASRTTGGSTPCAPSAPRCTGSSSSSSTAASACPTTSTPASTSSSPASSAAWNASRRVAALAGIVRMERVLGIGGYFIRGRRTPPRSAPGDRDHLGLDTRRERPVAARTRAPRCCRPVRPAGAPTTSRSPQQTIAHTSARCAMTPWTPHADAELPARSRRPRWRTRRRTWTASAACGWGSTDPERQPHRALASPRLAPDGASTAGARTRQRGARLRRKAQPTAQATPELTVELERLAPLVLVVRVHLDLGGGASARVVVVRREHRRRRARPSISATENSAGAGARTAKFMPSK